VHQARLSSVALPTGRAAHAAALICTAWVYARVASIALSAAPERRSTCDHWP
jgi:hypothetical protein